MNEELVNEWVAKAEQDYQVAKSLDSENFPNTICFHCQQAAEKYLKSILINCGEKPPRTHDLILLNEMVVKLHKDFSNLFYYLEVLNPFSVEYRYPGEKATRKDAKDAKDAKEAIDAIEKVRNNVKNILPISKE